MNDRKTKKQLEKLAIVRNRIALLEAERNEKIAAILTPEQVQQQIDIELNYDAMLSPLYQEDGELVEKIKTAVLKLAQTVRVEGLMAVWNKGKIKWNADKLIGYAEDHPGILKFRDDGNPSVSIRKMK